MKIEPPFLFRQNTCYFTQEEVKNQLDEKDLEMVLYKDAKDMEIKKKDAEIALLKYKLEKVNLYIEKQTVAYNNIMEAQRRRNFNPTCCNHAMNGIHISNMQQLENLKKEL